MSGDNVNQIVAEKLDKNNFHAWRFRITNFLMGKGYWEYIDGEQEEAPELPEEDPTAAENKSIQRMESGSKESHALAFS